MALITNTDSTILPYNDDYMVYDLDRHMYVLTQQGIRVLCGYDILELSGTQEQSDFNRYRISQDVYNRIRMMSKINLFSGKQYQIAKDGNIRENFKLALADQALYYKTSGAGDIQYQHGVNIEKGRALDLNAIRGKVLLSYGAEAILYQMGLLFTGDLFWYNIERDGTW